MTSTNRTITQQDFQILVNSMAATIRSSAPVGGALLQSLHQFLTRLQAIERARVQQGREEIRQQVYREIRQEAQQQRELKEYEHQDWFST